MTYEEFVHAVDGIMAYDTGCVSSGVRDERLRAILIAYVRAMSPLEHRKTLAKLVIDLTLSEDVIAQGYGPEDAYGLLQWLDNQGILLYG